MNTGIRVTVVLDKDLNTALHLLQAKEIQRTGASFSFSKLLNQELRKVVKIK